MLRGYGDGGNNGDGANDGDGDGGIAFVVCFVEPSLMGAYSQL